MSGSYWSVIIVIEFILFRAGFTKNGLKYLRYISLNEEFDGKVSVVQPEVKSNLEARIKALEKEVPKGSKSENNENKDKKEMDSLRF